MLSKLFICISLCLTTSLFAQGAPNTPSGPIYTMKDPQLEFVSLKTYDRPPDEQGTFAVQEFPRLITSFIYAKIDFRNLLSNVQEQQYLITFKWYLESGRKIGETSTPFLVEKERVYAWAFDSWGWDEPGNWPVGMHRVEVWINDTRFAVRNFTVVSASMED